MKKTGIWRGLAATSCFLLTLSVIVGHILEANSSSIDKSMGTLSQVTKTDGVTHDKFKPSADVLNADGTGNSTALIKKAMDLNRRQAAEGSVLLKNSNNALPLASGSKVSLLGIHSHKPVLGSAFGVKVKGGVINLEQALSKNKTDFANTIADSASQSWGAGGMTTTIGPTVSNWKSEEFDFDGAGFEVNPTLTQAYEDLLTFDGGKYHHEYNEGAEERFDPREPSLADLAAVAPSYGASFSQYGDAGIVVISRASGESHDYLPGGVVAGLGMSEPLALSDNEKALIQTAKDNCSKVIVLLNTSTAVEISELKNDDGVDAIMWIGAPGAYGMLGVADILSGKVSPSGGLFDIFPAKNMSAPAMQNMGKFAYANREVVTRAPGKMGGDMASYVMEAEGIYTGYRYYETRYYDAVYGKGNAKDPKGAYMDNTEWNYSKEVVYGFGYGQSYTSFDMSIEGEPVFKNAKRANGAVDSTITFNVTVKNTGTVKGKTPVQLYAQAPYTDGGVEKVAVQLLNYGKSSELAPGASETVKVEADLQYLASYDMKANGGKGGYIFDTGKYYFSVGNGAHDALNNILAKQGKTTADGLDYDGNAALAYEKNVDSAFVEQTAFSVSKTGAEITNQLPYSDWNYFQEGDVTYLSRHDWKATFPKTYDKLTVNSEALRNFLNGKYYEIQTNDNVSDIVWNAQNGSKFYQMWGKDYNDPAWQKLLDNMTLEEAQLLATFGGPDIPGAATIGTVHTYMTENAGNGIDVSISASQDVDAPWNIGAQDKNATWHPEVFGCAPLIASTFNPELSKELGQFVGIESLFCGIPILWGPGLNTHRHAYNGRNGEYYSEDPILSGVTAMEFAIGALDYGLIAAPKHYAFNDQETNRSGIAPYMTEQRAREVELRAYQYAFEATKYDTADFDQGMRGLMISFSKIGPVECTSSKGLMTEILAKEWGFRGYAVTDIYDDFDLYGSVLTSGATCFDTRGMNDFTLSNKVIADQVDGSEISPALFRGDATAQKAIKESCHKILFAMSQSHLMNRYNETTRNEKIMVPWRLAYTVAEWVSAGLLVVSAALYIGVRLLNRKEEN